MNEPQIKVAVAAGLALTDPNTDLLDVFRKHATGVLMLRQLLIEIGSGTIAISTTMQPDATPQVPNKGPALKKGAKKRVSKKDREPQPKKK